MPANKYTNLLFIVVIVINRIMGVDTHHVDIAV